MNLVPRDFVFYLFLHYNSCMDSNPQPNFWQNLWACIVALAFVAPIIVIFILAFFILSAPIIEGTKVLLPILGEDGLQLLASILTVMMFGIFYFFSQSNWIVSLRNTFTSKMPKVSSKAISYLVFILYLIPTGILITFIAAFLGIVNGIKTRFDWVYFGIVLGGLLLIAFLVDIKKKTTKPQRLE